MGATTQLRQLGGVIGLAATQAIRNGSYRSQLSGVLTGTEIASILLNPSNIATLSQDNAELTRSAYGESTNVQMKTIMGFAIVAFIASLFAWQKLPLHVQVPEAEQIALKEGMPGPQKNSDAQHSAGSDLSISSRITTESMFKERLDIPVQDEETNDSKFARSSTGSKFKEKMELPV